MSIPGILGFAKNKLALLASVTTVLMLVLFAMQQALRLPAGYGVNDFMGWSSTDQNAEAIASAIAYWKALPVFKEGAFYFLLGDTLFFIPSYSLLIYAGTAKLYEHLCPGGLVNRALKRIAPILLALLVIDDLLENLSGFYKLGWTWLPAFLGAHADTFNGMKFVFLFVALIPAIHFSLDLWLGFGCPPPVVQTRHEKWQGIIGVIGRSRYVLAALAVFAAFTLVLDQCRDVVLSMVADDASLLARILAIVLNALAGALFAYSCFLWARLIGMVQRISLPPLANAAVASSVGQFAQQWARFLALLPALMMVILLGYVTGDALAALRMRADTANPGSPFVLGWLMFFCVLVLVLCALFVKIRQGLSNPNLANYYNAVRLSPLLSGGSRLPAGSPAIVRALAYLLSPTVLPLFSLLILLALRLAPLFGLSGEPLALAELCLSLTWWLGVAGILSLIEQRTSIPWGLFLLVLAGILGLTDYTNNHQFSAPIAGAVSGQAAEYPAYVGALVILILAAVWWRLTRKHLPALSSDEPKGGVLFLGYAVLLIVIVSVMLFGAERFSKPATMLSARVSRPLLIDQLKARQGEPKTLYVVAAEGGGIRSAYWTALMLAELHEAPQRDIGPNILVVSGVSGGAMGAAVYRACLRQQPQAIKQCVIEGFRRLDALSPLLESFMMEDVLARVVPTPLCTTPGCDYLSRALPFERAWIAAFPALAEPLSPVRPGEPELMLNSTAVETGNRNTFSTVRLLLPEIPANNDIVEELKLEPRLVTAAHAAARFPFINPLALAKGPENKDFRHLADGGYYDNSGVNALADLMPTIRARYPDNPVRLILIRNGQAVASCEKKHHLAPPPSCLQDRPPAQQGSLANLKLPLQSPGQKFYADAFGPPAALFHVSGIGAHGRHPAGEQVWDNHEISPCLLDQESSVNLVPLGWYLSGSARQALELQAEKVHLADCLTPPPRPDASKTAALP